MTPVRCDTLQDTPEPIDFLDARFGSDPGHPGAPAARTSVQRGVEFDHGQALGILAVGDDLRVDDPRAGELDGPGHRFVDLPKDGIAVAAQASIGSGSAPVAKAKMRTVEPISRSVTISASPGMSIPRGIQSCGTISAQAAKAARPVTTTAVTA